MTQFDTRYLNDTLTQRKETGFRAQFALKAWCFLELISVCISQPRIVCCNHTILGSGLWLRLGLSETVLLDKETCQSQALAQCRTWQSQLGT